MFKQNEGITLVALVVTIIVLVILATVSINLVLGNRGIIGQSEEASLLQRAGAVEEKVNLYKMDYEAQKYVNTWRTQVEEDLLNELLTQKLVKENEINRIDKIITIGDKKIDYNTEQIDRTAFLMTVNSGEDKIVEIVIWDGTEENSLIETEIEWGDRI